MATKDHIEHIEKDGKMDWKKRRLGEDTSPYLGPRGCWGGYGKRGCLRKAVVGRDERPRSSAMRLVLLVGMGIEDGLIMSVVDLDS